MRFTRVQEYDGSDEVPVGTKKSLFKGNKTQQKVIAAFVVFVIIVGVLSAFFAVKLSQNGVYDGIYIGSDSVAGYSSGDLKNYIDYKYVEPLMHSHVEIKIGDYSKEYELGTLLVTPDSEKLANEIYNIGREGSIVERMFEIMNIEQFGREVNIEFSINTEIIDEILNNVTLDYNQTVLNPTFTIEDYTEGDFEDAVTLKRIVFTYGRNGLDITTDTFKNALTTFSQRVVTELSNGAQISAKTYELEIQPEVAAFKPIQKLEVMSAIPGEQTEASFERNEEGEIVIVPEVYGWSISRELLYATIDKVNDGTLSEETQTEILNLSKSRIALTEELYENTMFRDVIGKGSSKNDAESELIEDKDEQNDRKTNILNAFETLDGVTVLPNEEFSLRKTLGTINFTNGYIKAYERYSDSKEQVLGGGLSQVSTALYTALISTGLTNVTVSHNTYAPLFGVIDAYFTSADTQTDLKFTNTFNFPIKIGCEYRDSDDTIVISIIGTAYSEEDFAKFIESGDESAKSEIPVPLDATKYDVVATLISSDNFETIETPDPALAPGVRETRVEGIKGYKYSVYIVDSEDVTNKTLVASINYSVRNAEVAVGE